MKSIRLFSTSLFLCIFIFISGAFASDPAMEAEVSITPVGDFTASVQSVKGFVVKDGDTYKAEDIRLSMLELKTGMKLRDNHAQKYMETDKYPEAILVKAIGKGGKGTAKIKFHGIEKIVKGEYSVDGEIFIAKFSLSLKEFGISGINFKGAGVGDEVKVVVRVPVKVK